MIDVCQSMLHKQWQKYLHTYEYLTDLQVHCQHQKNTADNKKTVSKWIKYHKKIEKCHLQN